MSKNLADMIEELILNRLLHTQDILFSRNQLAQQLNCAPSQISYVLQSRFTKERGFDLQSRRGAGGFIRICRCAMARDPELCLEQAELKDLLTEILAGQEQLAECQSEVLNALKTLLEQEECSRKQLDWVKGALIHIVGR